MYLSYTVIVWFVMGILFDLVLALLARNISIKKVYHLEINKVKIHHSLIGLAGIFFSFFFFTIPLISFSLGEIISHSIREKSLLFIEIKNRKFF